MSQSTLLSRTPGLSDADKVKAFGLVFKTNVAMFNVRLPQSRLGSDVVRALGVCKETRFEDDELQGILAHEGGAGDYFSAVCRLEKEDTALARVHALLANVHVSTAAVTPQALLSATECGHSRVVELLVKHPKSRGAFFPSRSTTSPSSSFLLFQLQTPLEIAACLPVADEAESVTAALDSVCADVGASGGFAQAAARHTLERSDW